MTEATEAIDRAYPVRSGRRGSTGRLLRNPLGIGALTLLLAIALLGMLSPWLATHDPGYSSLEYVNAPVGTEGWLLGGDGAGRDTWARLLASINVALLSALIGTSIAVVLGGACGLVAGYKGVKTDAVASWTFNLLMAIPTIVLLIVLTPITGGAYQSTMAIFGVLLAPGIFRLVRNLVVGVRKELYIDAARVSGLSDLRVISRHVLYVIRGPIIVQAAFLATVCITLQAGLSFIGVGGQTPSFGSMISQAFEAMYSDPTQLVWPTLGLTLLSASLVLFGNAYRDSLVAGGSAKQGRRNRPRQPRGSSVVPSATADDATHPTETAPGDLLRVRKLRVAYRNEDGTPIDVVDDVSFHVGAGEIVGVVGESGSGKTQSAFAVLGLLGTNAELSAEEISLGGRNLLDPKEATRARGRDVGYVPQEPMANLDPSFTVGSQLVEGLRGTMSRREAKTEAIRLLGRVGIPDPDRAFRSYPHELSGGMAQRVLIAGAVSARPRLLIADEPTTALDVTVQAEILDLLRELQSDYQMGVLIVTHNFGVVADICDRVVVMRHGGVVETGTVRELFHQPKHPYSRELIAAILDEETVRTDDLAEDQP